MPIRPKLRPSGVYHLRGTHLGVRVDRSSGTRSLAHAKILAAKAEKEIFEQHAYGAKSVATFAEAAADYMRAGGEAVHMTPLIEAFGVKRLRDIDQSMLDVVALKLAPDEGEDAVTASSRLRTVYAPFIAVYNRAVAGGKAEPKKWWRPEPGKRRLQWLTPAEAERLIGALEGEPRTRALVIFYLGTGARASEALNAIWSDISPAAQRVQLWADITKAGADRHVDLGVRVRDALPARREPDDPVFLNTRGEPWHAYDAVNLALKRASKRAEIKPVSCHVLRHTFATWAYAVTRDLELLMKQGGWASPALAMRYMHGGTDDVAQAVRAHNWELLGKALPSTGKKLRKVS